MAMPASPSAPVHDAAVRLVFGSDWTNDDVTAVLVKAGWGFILIQALIYMIMPAPYGRYATTSQGFFRLSTRMSWMLQESPAFLVPLVLGLEAWAHLNLTQILLLAAFIAHYGHRTLIFPLRMRNSGPGSMPSLVMVSAFMFCAFNGFLQAHAIIYSSGHLSQLSTRIITGLLLFIVGMAVNVHSDYILLDLRQKSSTYSIPRGGCFEYVSAANYFGEICEWVGFAMACANSASLFFAASSITFLARRGIQHHRFYLEKFAEDYPKDRKAILPFLL